MPSAESLQHENKPEITPPIENPIDLPIFTHDIRNYAVCLRAARFSLLPPEEDELPPISWEDIDGPGEETENSEKPPENPEGNAGNYEKNSKKSLPEESKPALEAIEENAQKILDIINNPHASEPGQENAIGSFQKEFLSRLKEHASKLASAISSLGNFKKTFTAEQNDILTLLEACSTQLLKKINNPFVISQIENKTYEGHFEKTDFWEMLRETSLPLSPLAQDKDVTFNFSDGDLRQLEITVDRAAFDYLLMNLLKNAIEASPPGNKITISAKELEDKKIELCFHNMGKIPDKIERNFKEKYITSKNKNGHGLGTYIINLVSEFHGGKFEHATSEKEGTFMYITIPKR